MDGAAPRPRLQDRQAAPDLHGTDPDELRPGRGPLSHAAPATSSAPRSHWIDGRLIAADDPRLPGPLLDRPGCYTTARVEQGRARWAELHCRRLTRDARALGLGEPDAALILRAFEELGRSEFGAAAGVIQLKACRDEAGRLRLVATPRPLGAEPNRWRTLGATFPHPGPQRTPGAKLTHQQVYTRARALAQHEQVDEVLLFDARGRLVEGARSNILVVDADGRLIAPDPELGAVAGVALEVVRGARPDLVHAEIGREALRRAVEVIGVNAVRAAVAITRLDGQLVGGGEPGPTARALRRILSAG